MVDQKTIALKFSDGRGWDEYVYKHSGSSFYHLYGWGNAVEDVFGFRRFYIAAEEGGRIRGILPLALVDTFFGKRLVSVPIGTYAGPLGDDGFVEGLLIDRAVKLADDLGCAYLELRSMKKIDRDLAVKDLYTTFIKRLPEDPGECLQSMPRKARAAARKAIDAGLLYDTGLGYLKESYDIYAVSQRNVGSPVVTKKWFTALTETFKDSINILVVKYKGRCIASVLTFFFKDAVMPFYGGCIPEFFRLAPNNYMYLKLQEYGVRAGFNYFDFGRSRKSAGSYDFKLNQGFKPKPIYYEYHLNSARKVPRMDPSNRSFGIFRGIWRRLPVCLTRFAGPSLFRAIAP